MNHARYGPFLTGTRRSLHSTIQIACSLNYWSKALVSSPRKSRHGWLKPWMLISWHAMNLKDLFHWSYKADLKTDSSGVRSKSRCLKMVTYPLGESSDSFFNCLQQVSIQKVVRWESRVSSTNITWLWLQSASSAAWAFLPTDLRQPNLKSFGFQAL